MRNLAGDPNCDTIIRQELERAMIPVIDADSHHSEVPYTLSGKMGEFIFTRQWTYWSVTGRLPLAIAQEIYADPVGRKYVRVDGDASGPAPEGTQVTWFNHRNQKLMPSTVQADIAAWRAKGVNSPDWDNLAFCEDPAKEGAGFILKYHIDTEAGLQLFADTLRKYCLDK